MKEFMTLAKDIAFYAMALFIFWVLSAGYGSSFGVGNVVEDCKKSGVFVFRHIAYECKQREQK